MKLSKIRRIIREEVVNHWQRNVVTVGNDPYSYEDYPEVDVDMYADTYGGGHLVTITCDFDDSLSEPARRFPTEADAKAYAKEKSEIIHRAFLASQSDINS